MRNLLGRLHARSPESIGRIARQWWIPLNGDDVGRHTGTVYRVMTDLRAVRDVWARLDEHQREVVRLFASPSAKPLTLNDIASATSRDAEDVHTTCTELFTWGLLAREGDSQELPVGQSPKVFLPRELAQDVRTVIDEVEAGDRSTAPLRNLLEQRDEPDIEDTAQRWGIQVIPGLRRRSELVSEILKQVRSRKRMNDVVRGLSADGRRVWEHLCAAGDAGPTAFDDVMEATGLTVGDGTDGQTIAQGARRREVLGELESAMLVLHSYMADGRRGLFIPQEIRDPESMPVAQPLRTLAPVASEDVIADAPVHPFAIAWDLLTVVREIQSHGAPTWVPGEALSLSWQRQMNSRMWFHGDDVPPIGYPGFLLYLALGVGVLEPGPLQNAVAADKNAIRPVVTSFVREWRGRSFREQIGAIRDVWLFAEPWVEGREREMVDVWGAQWQPFRRRLLGALAEVDPSHWFLVRDVARQFAEQDSSMVGAVFTAASATSDDQHGDGRVGAVARIIEIELLTAMRWFGFIELGRAGTHGIAMRVSAGTKAAATDIRSVPEEASGPTSPVLSIDEAGLIALHAPAPLHIWSLMAFADVESLSPQPTYQLRPGSVSRALGAGFDLAQITTYLERQSGGAVPAAVAESLRTWTAGYRRVRLRRAMLLVPDVPDAITDLRTLLDEKGYEVVDERDGGVLVMMPIADGGDPDEALLRVLRAGGFSGQWSRG